MEGLHQLEIVILLLTVVLALTTVARKIFIPYPILLVIGGLVLGVIPGTPTVTLSPDLVFLVFLPPILWSAAYFTSWREFRNNLRPISLLAIGLVFATTAAVAAVAHAMLPGIGWAEAVALGAIVSPPDAVSATAIGKQLRVPRRIVTILEGESLVNDATALVLYRAAVGVAIGGDFILSATLIEFVFAAVVGVAIGIAVGLVAHWALCVTDDRLIHIGITLLAPYIAWVLGESSHASAVLACVAGGLHFRRNFSSAVAPATRIQARGVWDLLIFILYGVIFILIGLQLEPLLDAVVSGQFRLLLTAGALVNITAIVVRLVWVPLAAVIPRLVSSSLRSRDPLPAWSNLFVISWTGMRGIVTVAAALALPVVTATGAPFPFRAEIILVSFSVILTTLVLQGLSLTPLIRVMKLEKDPGHEEEERLARERAAAAALGRLDNLAGEEGLTGKNIDRLREHYVHQLQRFAPSGPGDEDLSLEASKTFRRLTRETLKVERLTLIDLRNDGTISDEVLHHLENELDIEALRLGIGDRRPTR